MKFSDITEQQWKEYKPFLDTCLLPVTGLYGLEEPWEATHELEYLRDAIDTIDIPYRGRVVVYPSYHYLGDENENSGLHELCRNIKQSGFRYMILISANQKLINLKCPGADLIFIYHPDFERTQMPLEALEQLWKESGSFRGHAGV